MKTYLTPVMGLLCLVLLSGCNERIEEIRQEAAKWKLIEEHAHQLRMEEIRLENERQIAFSHGLFVAQEAEKDREHEMAENELFYGFADPVTRFLSVVLAAGGLIYVFMLQQFRLKEIAEEQATLRRKHQLALEFMTKHFEKLSEEHKKLVLERLERPPPELLNRAKRMADAGFI